MFWAAYSYFLIVKLHSFYGPLINISFYELEICDYPQYFLQLDICILALYSLFSINILHCITVLNISINVQGVTLSFIVGYQLRSWSMRPPKDDLHLCVTMVFPNISILAGKRVRVRNGQTIKSSRRNFVSKIFLSL